jgi:amino acid adenylation domain-containing protein
MVAYLLHQLLTEAAASSPNREAVRCAGRSLSYRELEAASNGVARTLMAADVRPGDRVGIHVPKSVEAVAAIYGILKAGAAYVPLDPQAPLSRLTTVASDCRVAAVVTTRTRAAALLDRLAEQTPRMVVLVDDADGDAGGDGLPELGCPAVLYTDATSDPRASDPAVPMIDMDLAYILYTSGSTGAPKGVMLSHRNALAFVKWSARRIGVTEQDRISNHAPLHFDLSVFDLFLAALGRASVVLVPEEEAFFGTSLVRFISVERITIWYSVPSALMLITKALPGPGAFPQLHTVVFAGEVYPTARLRELRSLLPGVALWNLYGPTETNVCTYLPVERIPDDDRTLPIGRACENTEVFAVRDDGGRAGVGEVGELFVRGPTVMKGYWGRPEATAAVLAPHPLVPELGDRMYRTGDLVRLRPDGDYDFLGRRDHQIKSRGYRVELGDVEAALNSHPAVALAAAIAVPHEEWGTAIVACVVPGKGGTVTERQIRSHVASRLPRYMVPARVQVMSDLPKTSTGKVDRRRLQRSLPDLSDQRV